MSPARDDFSAKVIRALEGRVGSRCSICGNATSARHSTVEDRVVRNGQAGHITAAAAGGPRYDASLTPEQRASARNGIWLCGACHPLVDGDASRYTVDELRRYKDLAERTREDEMRRPGGVRADVSVSRLPDTGALFVGRDDELALLHDAWQRRSTRLIVLHALGGIGKTALLHAWLSELAALDFAGTERVFAWSFYSQGSDRGISADPFIETALEWFDDPEPKRGSPWEKGERLARAVKARRTLLVLDGIEPLQFPPGVRGGHIHDVALRTLLTELAAASSGLCVVTSRLPVDGIGSIRAPFTVQHELPPLDAAAVREVLVAHGATSPNESDYAAVAEAFDGHALAVTLLGALIAEAYDRDLRRWMDVGPLLPADRSGHAERVLRSYVRWLGEDSGEVATLDLIGLFDRPATRDEIAALRGKPIAGLTDRLPQDEIEWKRVLTHLRQMHLLHRESGGEETLDAHPIVREHFAQRLRDRSPEAWREANGRLFELLRRKGLATPPESLADLAPLYAAVGHAREAGRLAEALRVYHDDIHRGDKYYGVKQLGSSAMDLVCLGGFFTRRWSTLVDGLTVQDQGMVLNNAGYHLRASGRLRDALEATEAAYDLRVREGAAKSAAVNAITMSEINLLLADLDRAAEWAARAIGHARDSSEATWIAASLAQMAYTELHRGNLDQAERLFEQAEQEQAKRPGTNLRLLYSARGTHYCELFIARGNVAEAKRRAKTLLDGARVNKNLLDVGLVQMTLARAALADRAATPSDWQGPLRAAEAALQTADARHHYTRMLLTRAEAELREGRSDDARTTASAALDLARKNELVLYESEALRFLSRATITRHRA
jgi:hypothetical protein